MPAASIAPEVIPAGKSQLVLTAMPAHPPPYPQSAWTDHVYSPLVTVRDELFATLRDRPSIVSSAQFDAEKQSLARMLQVGWLGGLGWCVLGDVCGVAGAGWRAGCAGLPACRLQVPLVRLVRCPALRCTAHLALRCLALTQPSPPPAGLP